MKPQKPSRASVPAPLVATEPPCHCEANLPTAVAPTEPVAPSATNVRGLDGGQPRLRVPDRQQLLSAKIIDDLLEANHPARAVWSYVLKLDLSPLYDRIRARSGLAGRPAIDPQVLVALWLYATLTGVTRARPLARLCQRHDAFRWLAGGVSVNYHTLADFRTDNLKFLQSLLDQSVEVLRQQGLVDLDRVAQDGMRVRASAGAASFRRRETLERLLLEAQAKLQRLQQEWMALPTDRTDENDFEAEKADAMACRSPRQEAATMRHAEERVERIEAALERMPQLEAKIPPGEKKEARVSTTDADATVMKMADGGFRPAFNVEYSTACKGQAVVGVDVVTVGSDQGQMPPMLDQIEQRFGQRPQEALVDGGFVKLEDVTSIEAGGQCKVYAPVPKPKKETVNRYEPKATDSEEVAQWRQRMGTPQAQEIYKQRAATAECVNAQARNRGLHQFVVRGLEKAKPVALWFAIAHNMARFFALQPQLGGLPWS
jgi:transposase